jgi:hypothetical protein
VSLPFRFSNQNFVCTSRLTMRATFPAHLIFNVVTLIFGEQLKWWSSSCIFLHPSHSTFQNGEWQDTHNQNFAISLWLWKVKSLGEKHKLPVPEN